MWIPAGVDFGNENTVLCLPTADGIEVIPNPDAGRTTPTSVTYGDLRRYWGGSGESEQLRHTIGSVSQLKKLIGLPFASSLRESLTGQIGAPLVALDDGLTGIAITFREHPYTLRPEQILAYLLKGVDALATAREPRVSRFVLTASPAWNVRQRRIVAAACRLAGKPCLGLVNGGTAAAAAYATLHSDKLPLDNPVPALFLDFGSSGLTAAVARLKLGNVEMLSTTVDTQLGGSDFTTLFVQYLLSKVTQKTDPAANPRALIRFRRAADKLKKTLSINPVVPFEVQNLPGDVDVSFLVKREEFVAQIQDLIERISAPIEEALALAGVKPDELQIVEILGGGSRIPAVREKVAAIIGKEPTQSLNLDECFAAGAGYVAALLSPGLFRVPLVVRDISAIPVTAKWRGTQETVFDRFAPLPASTGLTVKAANTAEIAILSGDEEVGHLSVETGSEEEIDVLVKFRLNASAIVEIEGVVGGEDKHALSYTVEWLGQVSDERFAEMKAVEEAMESADRAEELIDETKNALEAALFALEEAVRDSLDYFAPTERENAEKLASDIRAWYDENEFDRLPVEEYRTRLEQLRAAVDPVTLRKRDRSNALEKSDAAKQRVAAIEKALRDDTQHATDPEHDEIQKELTRLSEAIAAYASRAPHDESPFDVDGLTKAVEAVASRQAQLKAKPIQIEEDWAGQRRADPIRNKLFGCGADDDWEPDRPPSRRSTENDENELRRRLSMEDLNDGGSDPWSQFFGGARRPPRYPQRGHADPGASARRAAEAEAARRAEIERQNEIRKLEAERREREEAERQRRSARWGQPWGASGWESADPFRRPNPQQWPDQAEAQRRRAEAEQRRRADEEQRRRPAQANPWGKGLGGQWGSSWNDAFF